MESTFHATVYSVVDRLLGRIATECMEDKPKLWAIWKEMFAFPQDPPKKKEVKPVEKTEKPKKEEKKPATKVEKPKETLPEKKVVVEEEKVPEKKVVVEEEKVPEKKAVVEEEKVPEKKVVVEEEKVPEKKVVVEEEKVVPDADPAHKSPKAAKAALGTCPWVYSKGPRQGQVCGSQIYSKQPECGLCHAHFKK